MIHIQPWWKIDITLRNVSSRDKFIVTPQKGLAFSKIKEINCYHYQAISGKFYKISYEWQYQSHVTIAYCISDQLNKCSGTDRVTTDFAFIFLLAKMLLHQACDFHLISILKCLHIRLVIFVSSYVPALPPMGARFIL